MPGPQPVGVALLQDCCATVRAVPLRPESLITVRQICFSAALICAVLPDPATSQRWLSCAFSSAVRTALWLLMSALQTALRTRGSRSAASRERSWRSRSSQRSWCCSSWSCCCSSWSCCCSSWSCCCSSWSGAPGARGCGAARARGCAAARCGGAGRLGARRRRATRCRCRSPAAAAHGHERSSDDGPDEQQVWLASHRTRSRTWSTTSRASGCFADCARARPGPGPP